MEALSRHRNTKRLPYEVKGLSEGPNVVCEDSPFRGTLVGQAASIDTSNTRKESRRDALTAAELLGVAIWLCSARLNSCNSLRLDSSTATRFSSRFSMSKAGFFRCRFAGGEDMVGIKRGGGLRLRN